MVVKAVKVAKRAKEEKVMARMRADLLDSEPDNKKV